jgi:hypothetical protein
MRYAITSSTKNGIVNDVAARYPVPVSCADAVTKLATILADREGAAAKVKKNPFDDVAKEYMNQFDKIIPVYQQYVNTCNLSQPGSASPTPGFTDQVDTNVGSGSLENVTDTPDTSNAADGLTTSSSSAASSATGPVAPAAGKKTNWLLIGGIGLGIIIVVFAAYKMTHKKA